jgi:hypothetical protein
LAPHELPATQHACDSAPHGAQWLPKSQFRLEPQGTVPGQQTCPEPPHPSHTFDPLQIPPTAQGVAVVAQQACPMAPHKPQ